MLLHRSASTLLTRTIYTVTKYVCKCTLKTISRRLQSYTHYPKRPTLSDPAPVHTSPKLALHPPLARLPARAFPRCHISSTGGTHFEQPPRHAPAANGPASGSFPLEEMEIPLIPGPRRGRLRPARRVWLDDRARAHSRCTRLFRPPVSRSLRCGAARCDWNLLHGFPASWIRRDDFPVCWVLDSKQHCHQVFDSSN